MTCMWLNLTCDLFVLRRQKKEEDQPTVLDGLVMWYLGLISSVSKAAMPIAPTLRDTLLTQSKLVRKMSICIQWYPL